MKNLEDSLTYQELFKKALAKGREEGREEGLQKALLRILKARFGALSEKLTRRVEGILSIEQLDTLIEKAAICSSLDEFEEGLETS